MHLKSLPRAHGDMDLFGIITRYPLILTDNIIYYLGISYPPLGNNIIPHLMMLPAPRCRLVRTFDPDLADYFYVPVYYTCMMYPIYSAADHPWFAGPLSESQRASWSGILVIKCLQLWTRPHDTSVKNLNLASSN